MPHHIPGFPASAPWNNSRQLAFGVKTNTAAFTSLLTTRHDTSHIPIINDLYVRQQVLRGTMRRLLVPFLASLQLCRARQPSFSIHNDLLAYPQVRVSLTPAAEACCCLRPQVNSC